jgi:uncharacterized protein related to proFAR isomerase
MDTSPRMIQSLRLRNYAVVNTKNEKIVEMNDILEFFENISENQDVIYITDIDGYEEGTPHLDLLSEISDYIEVWADAGSKHLEDVSDLLMAGVERVVLHTNALSINEMKEIWEETQSTICYLEPVHGQSSTSTRIDDVLNFMSGENRDVIIRHTNLQEIYAQYAAWFKNFKVYVDLRDVKLVHDHENRNIAGYIVEMDFDAV